MKEVLYKYKFYILIVAGVVFISGLGNIGIAQYQKYKLEKIEAFRQTQELEQAQQNKDREAQDLELAVLKEEIEKLKNKKPEVVTKTITKEAPTNKGENSLSYVAQYWRPVVVYVECDAYGIDQFGNISNIGVVTGSGTALYVSSSNQYVIWTNTHVTASSGGKLCRIWFPDTDSPLTSIGARISSKSDQDFATIDIPYQSEKMGSIIKTISDSSNFLCTQKPSVGYQVVILGYPGIGSQTDITVTEGIISGYDGNYFITSAKVEHGNSGGAAILVKDNCYLGIPTFVETGTLESLARILDWHKFTN